jgi:hypothetical protein
MSALPKYEPIPPGDRPAAGPAAGPLPAGPVLLTRLESESPPDFDLAPYHARGARILPLRPSATAREAAPPISPRVSASFRDLLIAGAIAIVLAICLALILGRGAPQPASPKPATPVAQTAAQTAFHAAIQTAAQTNAVHPAKPSAYGEEFVPPQATRRNHPTAPTATSATLAPASAAPAPSSDAPAPASAAPAPASASTATPSR